METETNSHAARPGAQEEKRKQKPGRMTLTKK
jgi:hypothetical protein